MSSRGLDVGMFLFFEANLERRLGSIRCLVHKLAACLQRSDEHDLAVGGYN